LPHTLDMIYKYKGDVAWCMKNIELALECYTKSIEINAQCTASYLNKALLLYDLDRYAEALPCYDALLALNPNNLFALKKKKESFYELKKDEKINLHTLDKSDRINSIFFYEKARTSKDPSLSLDYLSVALQIDPYYIDAARYMAAVYCDRKEFVKCIEYCDLVFSLDKYCEDMSVYEMKVHSLMSISSKRLHEAKRWADKALSIDSENQKFTRMRRTILEKLVRIVHGI
jgi:tetratricopeptide (TPR) repeat protein